MTTAICLTSDIEEGSAKGFPFNGGKVIIVKKDGSLYAYENRCPHFGINLEVQPDRFFSHDNQYLQCSMHGALFELDTGDCISGPCRGQPLRKVELTQQGDQVLLDESFEPLNTQF